MTTVTRIITQHDKEVARRLEKLFQHKKQTEGLSQAALAHKLGMTQPAIAQYLNGTTALRNAQTLHAFAAVFGVNPKDIDPQLETRFPKIQPATYPTAHIEHFSRAGEVANAFQPFKKLQMAEAYAVTLDDTYLPLFPKNTRVIADPMGVLKKNQLILIQRQSEFFIYWLHGFTAQSLVVFCMTPEVLRKALTKKGLPEELINTLAPEGLLNIPLHVMDSAHKIRGMEFPD